MGKRRPSKRKVTGSPFRRPIVLKFPAEMTGQRAMKKLASISVRSRFDRFVQPIERPIHVFGWGG